MEPFYITLLGLENIEQSKCVTLSHPNRFKLYIPVITWWVLTFSVGSHKPRTKCISTSLSLDEDISGEVSETTKFISLKSKQAVYY